MLTTLRLPVSYTGLSPDNITPMPGEPKRCTRAGDGVRFEINVRRARRVILVVRRAAELLAALIVSGNCVACVR